jgi:hypothetical protein
MIDTRRTNITACYDPPRAIAKFDR